MTYSVRKVELSDSPLEYQALIYPRRDDLFEKQEGAPLLIAFCALKPNPVGLITAFYYPEIREAFIASFYLAPQDRHQGLGTKLMQTLLEELKEKTAKIVQIQYNSSDDGAPFLEKILTKTHWSSPQVMTKRYYLNSHSFHPSWFLSPSPLLPPDCTLFLWSEATKEDIEQAKIWVRESDLVALYSPFNTQHKIEEKYSLGLYFKGKLAGWMIVTRLSPTQICYSSLFVIPELRGTGVPISLLKEAIRRHLNDQIDTEAIMEIHAQNPPREWIRFVKKRLAPFAFKIEEIKSAYWITS